MQGIADVVNTRLRLLAKAAKFVKLLAVNGQMQIAFLFSEDNQRMLEYSMSVVCTVENNST